MDLGSKIERYHPAAIAERGRLAAPAAHELVEMEKAADLLAYWGMLRKRRWTILTVFFVLFTVVLLGTLKQKPLYRARALLEIQPEHPEILTAQDLFQLETLSDTYLESQYKILESDTLARRVIDQLRLDKLGEFNPPPGWWTQRDSRGAARPQTFAVGDAGASRDPEAIEMALARFKDGLAIEPIKRSRLVAVSFESHERALAARVVNTLAANYVEQSLEVRWEAAQKATEWLSQQLVGLKARLEKSEDELQNYARENGLLFLETEKGTPENIVNGKLRQLQEELTRAQAARYEKESLYRLIRAGDYGSLPGVFENKLMQDLTVRLAELKREHAQLTTMFTSEYPKVKQIQNQIDEIEGVLAAERQRAARRITNDYLAAVRREDLLRAAFEEEQKQANRIAERSVQYNILKREVETNKQLYEGLLQRMKEAGVSAGLKASNIRVVDFAVPPKKPSKPRIALNLALGIVLGLGLGVGTAFLQEHLDNTLKSPEDVENFLHLPALAAIPSAGSLNHRRGALYGASNGAELQIRDANKPGLPVPSKSNWHRIDLAGSQASILSEAFRGLRTSVLLSTAERPPRALLVTSPRPGDGKTTVTVNLAISLTQLGERVLLVDGDLRRPSIQKAFGIHDSMGLVRYLTGDLDWQGLARPTGLAGLDALVSGPLPPNPAELLSSERMRRLIREAADSYNFVVIDSPPVLSVADARILATLTEGVILVVRGAATPRELVQRTRYSLRNVGANIIGVVLNNLDVSADGYYYYYYKDYLRYTPGIGSEHD